MKGIMKLTIFCDINNHSVEEKFVAIKNANGGPKITQHEKAIIKSEITKNANFCFLVNSFSIKDKFFMGVNF